MKSFTITMEKEKETKNTNRFSEVVKEGEPSKIGVLYIQKYASIGASKIKVTVEEVN